MKYFDTAEKIHEGADANQTINFHWPYQQSVLLNTVQWLFDFKKFDWFGGHQLSAHIPVIDYIWKTVGN